MKGKMQQSTQVEYKPCTGSTQQVDRKALSSTRPAPGQHIYIVRPEDRLRLPYTGEVPHVVRTLLRGGERIIVVDLVRVSKIDAAGIGDLVRAYNLAMAGNGRLRIANANPWVRKMLERARLFERLSPSLTGSRRRNWADC
jgi:anti-anti-sigma factor